MKFPWFIFLVGVLLSPLVLSASTWRTYDGESFEAVVSEFNFDTKDVVLEYPDTETKATYNTKDLDFQSKRRLLFSPVFHNSFPDGGLGMWSQEKLYFFALAILSPVVLLVIGMWLSALFIAKKFNPFSAIGAFLGSWIAGILLVACYLVFAAKSGGGGAGFIWAGAGIATIVMALFISAIYKTNFFKGLFIFVAHLVFAALVGYLLVFSAEIFFPAEEVSAFWDQWVFSRVGLVDGPQAGY